MLLFLKVIKAEITIHGNLRFIIDNFIIGLHKCSVMYNQVRNKASYCILC